MGMHLEIKSLDADTVLNTVGKVFPLGECDERASLQITGIVAGDEVTPQYSNNGTTWVDGSAITDNGITDLNTHYKLAQAKLTAVLGGGSVTALFSGYHA